MSYDLKKEVDEFESKRILGAMQKCNGNKTDAAKKLGIKRTTLLMKLKRIDDEQKVKEVVPG